MVAGIWWLQYLSVLGIVMVMSRFSALRPMALAAALLSLGLATLTEGAAAADLVDFRIAGSGAISDPYKAPTNEPQIGGVIGYALYLGNFKTDLAQAGFNYQGFAAFPRTAAALLALSSGQAEVASTGDSPAVLSRSRGDKNRAILVTNPSDAAWVIGRSGGPQSIKELGGHKTAVLFGSTASFQLESALDTLGIKDAILVQLPAQAALAALVKGDIDAYVVQAGTAELWRRQNPSLKIIGKLNDIDPTLGGVGVITVREDFLAKNPTFPAAFWKTLKATADEIHRNPERFFAWEAERTGTPIELLKLANPAPYAEGPISPTGVEVLKRILAFRLKAGEANAAFPIEDWVVNPNAAKKVAP